MRSGLNPTSNYRDRRQHQNYREYWSLFIAVLAVSMFAFYQNCQGTPGADNSLYASSSSCSPTDPTCANAIAVNGTAQPSRIYLSVKNANPIVVSQSDIAFDVTGDCGSGGYPQAEVIWQLKTSGTVVSSGTSASACDSLGRLRLYVPFPTGFNKSASNAISLELVGVQGDGTIVHQPLGYATANYQIVAQ